MHLTTLVLAAAAAATSRDPAPFDQAGFAAQPQEIARWAAAHPAAAGASVEVLLDENVIKFDAAGRATIGSRLVYRTLTSATAEKWGGVGRGWNPWHEEVPLIRARVIHPDGAVHVLDPATLSQSSAHEHDPVKYGDGLVLRGPLPGIRPGDVVETETVTWEKVPYFDAGRVIRMQVGWGPPSRRLRIHVEAPASLPLRWTLLGGVRQRPDERTRDGVRVLEWDVWDVPELPPADEMRPPEAVQPEIAVSTGTSWAAVAEAYGARVEERLRGAELEAVAREVGGSATAPAELAQRFLDWISSRVRYTALELGEASIIPTRPADTLSRGYGDCKDLSTLLVGLLRARGVRAEVAVVRAAPQDPVDLPGLGEFNHVIVHVPGDRPLWIDPTDPDTPVGELPIADQSRMALVAAKGSTRLVRLPELGPKANGIEVEREIVMPEAGLSRVVMVTRTRGFMAAYHRSLSRRNAPEELLRKDAEEAAGYAPGAVLVTAVHSGADKSDGPMEGRYEFANSSWGYTETDTAEATCRPEMVLADLPTRLRSDPSGSEAPRDGPPGQDVYLWVPPYIAEERCTITPPPGFQPDPLPEPLRVAEGPVAFERSAEALSDGRIRVRSKLTVSGRRLRDREARDLRRALFPLLHEGLAIKFQRTSAVLLREGKGREALDEIRRLIRLHPNEARHRVHLAVALRELGLGEASRAAAREAIAREPRNAWAHRALALVLGSDLLGRWSVPGCDREGAIAAQRRAIELEGASPGTSAGLAELLEMGVRCFRFGPGAQLAEALKIRERLRADGDREHEDEYLDLLLRLGRFDDAAELARSSDKIDTPQRRDAALVVGALLAKGRAAAVRELERLGGDDRKKALDWALDYLVGARRWDEAAELFRAANAGGRASADVRAVADALAKVDPESAALYDAAAPRAVVARLLHAAYVSPRPAEELAQVLSDELRRPERADDLERVTGALLGTLRKDVPWLSASASADLVPALFDIEPRGDDAGGWEVRVRSRGGSRMNLYVARQGKVCRIIAYDFTPGLLGDHAASLVRQGKLEAARRVLGWVRAEDEDAEAAKVLETLLEDADRAAPDLALAADALSAYAAAPRRDALERLAAAQRKAEKGERKRALTTALAQGLRGAKRWEELLALVGSAGPYASAAFDAQAEALVALRRPDELRSAADARLARAPGDLAALRAQRDAAVLRGDAAGARKLTGRILSASKAEAEDFAKAAWSAAFLDPPPDEGLQHARKASELAETYPTLVALATMHAARGEPAEALRILQQALDRRWGWDIGPEAWLVIGRIEEAYGLAAEAKAAYARTGADPASGPSAFEAEELAARWSRRL